MENLSFYNGSILAGAVTTAVLALCLILVKPPQTKTFDVYRRSKIILGMGYAVYAIGISAFIAYPFRAEMPNVATAINLTYYFAAAFLFGCSFISLLSPSFCSTERIKRYVITYFTYVILLWTVTLSLPSGLCPAIHIAFGVWFVIQALILIRVFLRSYRRLRRQLDNEYADATATFIEWLHKSAWCVIVFGILCGVFTFLPRICIASLMATGIFVFIYIYISMQNYALHLSPVQYVADNPLDEPAVKEVDSILVDKIEQWITDRGYCNEHITLESFAGHIGTNRTYISSYINTRYRCSFSAWINGMRLELARSILVAEPSLTLADISRQCGFSSTSCFSKLFKNDTGQTPTEYKRSFLDK